MLRNRRGFTFIEVLIAVVMTLAVAYASMTLFPTLKVQSHKRRAGGSCGNYLDAVLNNVEVLGTSPRIVDNPPIARVGETLPMLSSWKDVSASRMSPYAQQQIVAFVNSNTRTQIRSSGLYWNSLTLTHALYSENASTCTSYSEFTASDLSDSTLIPPPPQDMTTDFRIRLTIQPIDLTTREVRDCSDSGFGPSTASVAAPKGIALTTTQGQIDGIANAYSETRNNVGYEVTVTALYQTNGVDMTCTQSRTVASTADLTAPPAPSITMTYDHTYDIYSYAPYSANITFSYGSTTAEPGVTLMCRDTSVFEGISSPPPTKWTPVYSTSLVPAASNSWMPCDRITACGKSQTLSGWPQYSGTSNQFQILSRWVNGQRLPYGCRVRLEAKAIDPAGNVSDSAYLDQLITDP